MTTPDPTLATAKAPAVFQARFETTRGAFVIAVHRDWSPNGADRFYNLVKLGFYDDVRFFRAVEGFMVQFGLHGSPDVNVAWRGAPIADDPVTQSNKRGFVSFATSGPNARTTQVFVNYVDRNVSLDSMGFSPFGQVVEGMDVVDSLHKGYGESPNQGRIRSEGNAYLDREFPLLDRITKATLLP